MTTPTPEPSVPLQPPAEPYSPPATLPPYPPYINERQLDTTHLPESTLEKLHSDDGVIITPPGQTLGPPPLPHGPDYTQSPIDPHVWYPDKRPLAPGSTVPAGYHSGSSPSGDSGGTQDAGKHHPANGSGDGAGHLDVRPEDLLNAADDYSQLAAQLKTLSPQAAAEVQRIIDTHGPMGYPAALGIAQSLAAHEGKIDAKSGDLLRNAQRLTEHARAYSGQDADLAADFGDIRSV